MSMLSQTWRLYAKCLNDEALQESLHQVRKGNGFDPFFDKPESYFAKWAKEYCLDCPVRLACLAEAMKSLEGPVTEQLQGIWGGQTKRTRVAKKHDQQEQILQIVAQMKELFQGADGIHNASTTDGMDQRLDPAS